MYAVLKILVRLTLLGYFRKIRITGKEHIKKDGPYIFISNHPSAFMDPLVVATSIKPTIYFLAAGEYMGKGFKFWFMNKFLNMIPVYRPDTMPGDTHKNEAIFDKCIEHLNKGRSILVFPEGVSSPERKILPLKTGVARIVRATEQASGLKTDIQIIPIGLNYTNPHRFRSDLYVNIGEPLKASDYLTMSEDTAQEEVKALTSAMEEHLISTVLHMEMDEFEDILDKVNESYARDLKAEMGVEFKEQEKEFELNKLIINAISFFKEKSPDSYEEMRSDLDGYLNKLREHKINDRELRQLNSKTGFPAVFFAIWGAPLFIIGFFGNFIPYVITKFLTGLIKAKDTFRGSITILLGMFIFLGFYAGIVIVLWKFTPLAYFTLFIPVVLYLTGLHTILYLSVVGFLRRRRKLRLYLRSNAKLSEELHSTRESLISRFQAFRAEFDAR